jgi:hypothetical protein
MEHPVTGGVTYTNSLFTTPSKGLSHEFERCQDINLGGYCFTFTIENRAFLGQIEDEEPSF